jgi:hypothetical protein
VCSTSDRRDDLPSHDADDILSAEWTPSGTSP